nr:MAG TPA: cytidylyltransferase-like protein [Caudoviricetes sp.]
MKLELKEHEIEQAIETFISSFVTGHPVKVKGFDLQGMRSKDGLSAIVDFDVVGVSDLREVKTESSNVKPTNTAWREEVQDEPKVKHEELSGQDLEDWKKFLELLTDNAQYKNYDALLDLVDTMSESLQQRASSHPLYVEMLENTDKAIQSIASKQLSEPVEDTEGVAVEEPIPEPEVEHAEAIQAENEAAKSVEEEPKEQPKNFFGAQLGVKPSNVANVNHTVAPTRKLFPAK